MNEVFIDYVVEKKGVEISRFLSDIMGRIYFLNEKGEEWKKSKTKKIRSYNEYFFIVISTIMGMLTTLLFLCSQELFLHGFDNNANGKPFLDLKIFLNLDLSRATQNPLLWLGFVSAFLYIITIACVCLAIITQKMRLNYEITHPSVNNSISGKLCISTNGICDACGEYSLSMPWGMLRYCVITNDCIFFIFTSEQSVIIGASDEEINSVKEAFDTFDKKELLIIQSEKA